jgi:tripartite ATP-independent transporter DctP family solute receptor
MEEAMERRLVPGRLAAFALVTVLLAGPAAAQQTWKLASAVAPGDRQDVATQLFVDQVNQALAGRITIQYYKAGQLGNERELTEGVKLGTIELGMTSTSAMTTFVPELAFYDLPFLFRDKEHARKVATGAVGDKLLKTMEKAGIKGLATAESGFRLLLTNRVEVKHPSEMVGLKYRVIESPTHMAAFRALGASAVPIPFGEVYGALQQRVVDGMDLPLGNISAAKLNEVVKNISLTEHIYTPHVFIMNLQLFSSLSAADQKTLVDAARAGSDLERKLNDELVPKWSAELQQKGMKIIAVPDKRPFMEKMRPVWAQFERQIGKDLIEEAVNTK